MTIREFLELKVNCEYITIVNNKGLNKKVWQGRCETINHEIPKEIANSEMVKWSVIDNGIVLWINL